MVKTCFLRTHKINLKCNIEAARINIYSEVSKAVNDGYTRFVVGVEGDADIIFAKAVQDIKHSYPCITLEIEIPSPEHLSEINENPIYLQIFEMCDAVSVIRNKNHTPDPKSDAFADIRYIDL